MRTRDKVVVVWFAILYSCCWAYSLAPLFDIRFWDRRYALSIMSEDAQGIDKGFQDIAQSFYSKLRYVWFLPHVLGAIFWWNLYFFQLIPKIRHNYKAFHRMLGRFLMVILLLQNITGFALASTTRSKIVMLLSYILNIAAIFCIVQAWRYAYWRDIPKHKYWVLRLVGYMQTIALQRFWFAVLIISHSCGWYGLYPQLDDDSPDSEWEVVVKEMFDHSFVLCILTAFLTTELYLAMEQGMLEPPVNNRVSEESSTKSADGTNESSSLIPATPYGAI